MRNDYLKETKKKIGNYVKTKDLIELRKKDIEVIAVQSELADEVSKARMHRNIKGLEVQVMTLELEVEQLERGFSHLDPIARKVLDLKYSKKESWVAVGLATGYCTSMAKKIGKESLLVVGECLYGLDIHQDLPIFAGAGCY